MTNQLPQPHHQPQRRAVDLRIPAIEKYAYCLCLHVRPTTIFIAVFKLIRALLFASILLNAELSTSMNEDMNQIGISIDERHRSTQIAIHIMSRLVMASVSAVGIYAVITGRAALLMPLYAMLLVDFFFALPAFYNRDLDSSLADSMADFRNYSNGNNQYTRYSFMIFSTITMIVKIYFLCVIWKCYRYLRLIELVSPIRLSEIYPHIHQTGPQYPIVRVLGSADSTDLGNGHNVAPPPYDTIASNMKPPNYEEAIKTTSMQLPQANDGHQQVVIFTNPTTDQVISESGNHHQIGSSNTSLDLDTTSPHMTTSTAATSENSQMHSNSSTSQDKSDAQHSGQEIQVTTNTSSTNVSNANPTVSVVIPKVENNSTRDTRNV